MKSKQLANVLIKGIGLYVCVCAIPGLVAGLVIVFASAFGAKLKDGMFYTGGCDRHGRPSIHCPGSHF
jgi:hypothetical protein